MKRIALISALVLGAAAPAFADANGFTSPAEIAAQHDFSTDFRASADLGVTSPAELAGNDYIENNNDVVSTQNIEVLRLLGLTSPAEIAAAKR